MYIIVPLANNPWQEMILPASQLVFCRQGFFANFEIANVEEMFPKHEANLVEFTLEKKKTSKRFPVVVFFFGWKKQQNLSRKITG
jgi:hypothetical protein